MHKFGFQLCIRILDGFLEYSALTLDSKVQPVDQFSEGNGWLTLADALFLCYNCCYDSAIKLLLWLLLLQSLNTNMSLFFVKKLKERSWCTWLLCVVSYWQLWVDVWIHRKVRALPCRLQDTEEDTKIISSMVQEVPQRFTSEEWISKWIPAAAVHFLRHSSLFSSPDYYVNIMLNMLISL
jgi:hypothetical protein